MDNDGVRVAAWTKYGFRGIFTSAFVALVLPFDSFIRLQGQTLRPFFAGERMSRRGRRSPSSLRRPADGSRVAMQSQLEVGSGVKGTRNSKVVQCFKGLWFHPTANGGRRFRALLRDHDGRL